MEHHQQRLTPVCTRERMKAERQMTCLFYCERCLTDLLRGCWTCLSSPSLRQGLPCGTIRALQYFCSLLLCSCFSFRELHQRQGLWVHLLPWRPGQCQGFRKNLRHTAKRKRMSEGNICCSDVFLLSWNLCWWLQLLKFKGKIQVSRDKLPWGRKSVDRGRSGQQLKKCTQRQVICI